MWVKIFITCVVRIDGVLVEVEASKSYLKWFKPHWTTMAKMVERETGLEILEVTDYKEEIGL